jgi:hypothetical protein
MKPAVSWFFLAEICDYLILDTSSTQLVEIGSANSLLAKDRMAQVHPFTISSTEGHE